MMMPVIKNFQEVIENKDIDRMKKELYDFLILHCGFIAHYNIDRFKATYRSPRNFAEGFIRHFDREHRYYTGIHACDETSYKDTVSPMLTSKKNSRGSPAFTKLG